MIKVKVNGKVFYTTSVLSHLNGTYPIFTKFGKWHSFEKKINVKFTN